jgi:hypothetical protein
MTMSRCAGSTLSYVFRNSPSLLGKSVYLNLVGCSVGIGSERGRPPIMGLGQPPEAPSNPLRLKMMRICSRAPEYQTTQRDPLGTNARP